MDSIAVSIFVDILVKLTILVFVNDANIETGLVKELSDQASINCMNLGRGFQESGGPA